jgi:hypothetical protein
MILVSMLLQGEAHEILRAVDGIFFQYLSHNSTLLHLQPLRFTVSEDAGIEPRTIETSLG